MKKIQDMTVKEKAALLKAISKIQISNKAIGTYAHTEKESDRVVTAILDSIR